MEEATAAQREPARVEIRWMIARLSAALGWARSVMLVLLSAAGSLTVLVIGFSAIAIVQVAASDGSDRIRGIPVPDIALTTLMVIVVAIAMIGVASLLGSEWLARSGARACATALRREVLARVDAFDPTVSSVVIQDVRHVASSALVVSRLPGPATIVVGSGLILMLLDPLLTTMLAPFALVMVVIGRRMRAEAESLSVELEGSRARGVELFRNERSDVWSSELHTEAERGDDATLRLAGQSSRSQAAGLASVALMLTIALLGTDVSSDASTTDVARLIIYVLVARLLVRSLQQITATRAVISRHLGAIRRCRRLVVGEDTESG